MRILVAGFLLALLSGRCFAEEPPEDLKKRFGDVAQWHGRIVVVIKGEGRTGDEYFQQTYSTVREAEVTFRMWPLAIPGQEAMLEMALNMAQKEKDKAELRKQLDEMKSKKEWGPPILVKRKPEEWDDVRLVVDDRLFSSGKEACGDPFHYSDSMSRTGRDTRRQEGNHRLAIDFTKKTYELQVDASTDVLEITETRVSSGGDPAEKKEDPPPKKGPGPATGFPSVIPRSVPLPGDGTVLSGSEPFPKEKLPFGSYTYGRVTGTVTWWLSPEPLEDVELVLEPENYDTWRPTPGRDEQLPGNRLPVKATLQLKGGGRPAKVKMKSLGIGLKDVSTEPGVCLNWPTDAKKDFDLQFYPPENQGEGVTVEPSKLGVRRKGGEFLEHTATLVAYDGGAWGTLKADAVLTDGRFVRGILKGEPGSFDILLPKRSGDSKIADAWKKDQKATGKKDDADDENDPVGDGQKGDGLTLYEEYRAFWVDGEWAHWRCDPLVKDLFLHNDIGDKALGGLWRFESATGIRLHYKLAKDEILATRVINFNHFQGAHIVDQHGLILREGKDPRMGTASFCDYVPPATFPGPPKNTKEIVIHPVHMAQTYESRFDRGGEVYSISGLDSTIAHELGHAVGLRHHGESDSTKTWVWKRTKDGEDQIWEDGTRVIVFEEKTKAFLSPLDLWDDGNIGDSRTVWLGERQGQHSGDEACLMRYDIAKAYRSQADLATSRFYHWDREVIGIRLCTSPAGTGKNMPTHDPQSRHGGCARGRGNCKHMFVVSDKWEKKSQ